jgi:hypothetical protein
MTFKKSNLYCLLIIIFFSNNVARVQSTTPIKINLLNQLNLLNLLSRFNFTKHYLKRDETWDKTQHIRVARDGDQPNVMQIVACATEDRCQTIKDIMCDPDTYDSLRYLQSTLTSGFWEQASQSDNREVCITNRQKLVDGFSAMYRSMQDELCDFATESEEEIIANLMLLYNNIFCATNGDGDFCGSALYSNIDIIPNDSDGCVDENENLFDEDCQESNRVIVDTGCCVWSMLAVYIRTGDSHTSTCPEGMRQSFSEDYVTEYLDTCNIDHNNDIESRACGGSLDTTGGTTDTMLSTSDDTSSNSNIGLIVMGIIIGVVLIGTIINQIYIYFTNRREQIDNNCNNENEDNDNNNDSVSGEEDVFYGNNSPKPTSSISINFENPIQNRKLQKKRRRTLPKIPIENINKNNTVSV